MTVAQLSCELSQQRVERAEYGEAFVTRVNEQPGNTHQRPVALSPEDYARAERYLPWNANQRLFGAEVVPHWNTPGDAFWYWRTSRNGKEVIFVDAKSGTRELAFDHERLAAELSRSSGIPVDPTALPLADLHLDDDRTAVDFTFDGSRWTLDLNTYACEQRGSAIAPDPEVVRSPDGKWDAFVRNDNLWVRSVQTGKERQLSTNGDADKPVGKRLPSPLIAGGLDEPDAPVVIWSPDSQRLLTCRLDATNAKQYHLVQSVPLDGSIRPRLHSYAYPLPGDADDEIPHAETWCFDLEGESTAAQIDPLPMLYYGSPLNTPWVQWSDDSSQYTIITRDRGFQAYRMTAIDARSGEATQIAEESSTRGIDPYLHWASVIPRVLGNGEQVIWYSHQDGWGHLYLYDAGQSEPTRQLTHGAYMVAEVLHVDTAKRIVYFTALGREAGRDPYFTHLYSVSLDGGTPTLLTPENADHTITFAPGGAYFIDTYSTVATPPVSVLRTAEGRDVAHLEEADASLLLAAGWQLPERFTAKARDGVTDIYGVIYRPSTYDPNQSYPVVDYIYGGPQVNQAPTSFADVARGRATGFWHAQALAELGFMVVMIDGLGMPGRSKAYHDVSYRNLADGGIPDHITAIQQLADRYPSFDLSNVGIFGHSAGGYASAQAIFTHPEFYKVCVSSAGNHDHRLDKATWVERYMGLPVEDHYRAQANQTSAKNLEGKLLLIHGDMDENVHIASTLVVVDALIAANKDFDLLIMPNRSHACGNDPYFVRRRWDYFVTHLLGATPPQGYRISGEENA